MSSSALNDHDYCSPNKSKTQKLPPQVSKDDLIVDKELVLETSLPDSEANPSQIMKPAISMPAHELKLEDEGLAHGEHEIPRQQSANNCSNDDDNDDDGAERDDNISDSSSSLSSSATSSKDLIIAQDRTSLPVSEPNVLVKRKPGRPPGSAKKSTVSIAEQSSLCSARAKRIRQTTSVTDKSEWLMGEDQIDSVLSEHLHDDTRTSKRKSSKEHDSAYDQFTSSEYSSSEADSEQSSDYNSEDDPDRLWCVCQKPHGEKFMICCDICKDWFHGHCVGVTKLMGDRFEKQGKEWFCAECSEKLRSGVPRNAIPKKRLSKEEKKRSASKSGKRGRGRPRKSDVITREGPTRTSQRITRKSSSSLDPRTGVDNSRLKKNLARADARSESFGEFEDSQKLKQLIRERKKSFFHKRELSAQMKAAKRHELGLGKHSLTAHLSQGLDSLASSTSTPNMSNLPINIKSEQKEKPKPNIVLQINTKKDSGLNQNDPSSRIVTAIVRSPKKSKTSEPTVNDLFTAEPIQINKKVKVQSSSPVGSNASQPITGDIGSTNCDSSMRKRSNSISKKSPTPTDQGEVATPKKKRKDSDSGTANGPSSSPVCGSKHIAKKIKESLEQRCKQLKDLEISSSKIEQLAFEIEGQLNGCFKEGSQKYLNKFRSLMFNLSNVKNPALVLNVLTGEIPPAKLVRMSAEEMAPHELAKWRERENKHSIELIKRDAQLQAQQVIVKKTHKGEEVISAPVLNESEDPTAEVSNQNPPTTPTKHLSKEARTSEGTQGNTPSPGSSAIKSAGPLKMKITGLSTDASLRPANLEELQEPPLSTTNDPSGSGDLIKQESKIETLSSSELEHEGAKSKFSDQDDQPDQPKRFRVSIDTKLNPANLLRLTEPLIKPSADPPSLEHDDYSPSQASPNEIQGMSDERSQDSYRGAGMDASIKAGNSVSPPPRFDPSKPCWSGIIHASETPNFSATAKPLTGPVDFMKEEMFQNLMVCGRIAPDQVQSYIKKLKSTVTSHILVVQFFPSAATDKVHFDAFFDYLYSRNRYGVISASPQVLRDFYIIPIHDKANLPEALRPARGPNPVIDRRDSNCLLGLLVRSKRTTSGVTNTAVPSAPIGASYTPSRIK